MIPLLHDFTGERVLVVGGGTVGARKARRFAREARTIVCSPTFDDVDFDGAHLVRARLDPSNVGGWLDRIDPALVVAATDDESLNQAIETAALERGLLVNRTDEDGKRQPGSVVVPATVRRDPVVLAMATGGRSPAVSRALREHLEDDPLISNAGSMAELTAELREQLRKRGMDPAERRRAMRTVVKKDRVWKALDTPGTNPREIAASVISDVIGDSA